MSRSRKPPGTPESIPAATAKAWEKIAPLVPASARLAGGTGLAVYMQHRTSRDLDFVLMDDEDLGKLAQTLDSAGDLKIELLQSDTLNATLDGTKLQFLRAHQARELRPPTRVAGLAIASIEDIAAMKLAALQGRGKMRDYFDLMKLDQGPVPTEDAVRYFGQRYESNPNTLAAIQQIPTWLGSLDDVEEDPELPGGEVIKHWRRRHREIAKYLGVNL